jgi:hypothetical protein
MGHQMRQSDRHERQQQRKVLAGNFVNDHVLRIFPACIGSHAGSAPNAECRQKKEKHSGNQQREGQRGVVDVGSGRTK